MLNISPESAVGGNRALLQTGDRIRTDLNNRTVQLLVDDEELAARRRDFVPAEIRHQTPWQEMYRACVGQLSTGCCSDFATRFRDVATDLPRHHH